MGDEFVTRKDCSKTSALFMDSLNEVKEIVTGIRIQLAKLPGELTNTFDERYAQKKVETDVASILSERNKRDFEWLKTLIVLVLGAAVGYLSSRL